MPGKAHAIGAASSARPARPDGPPGQLKKQDDKLDNVEVSSEAREPEAEVTLPDFKEWAADLDKEAREVDKSGNPEKASEMRKEAAEKLQEARAETAEKVHEARAEGAERLREAGGTPPGLAKKGGLPPGQAKKLERSEPAREVVEQARTQRQTLSRESIDNQKVSQVPVEALSERIGPQAATKVVELARTHSDLTVARVVRLGEQAGQAADLLAKRPGLQFEDLVDRGVNGADTLKPVLTHEPSRELLERRPDVSADELGSVADRLRQTFSYRGSEVYDKVLHTLGRRPGLAASTVVLEAARVGQCGASEEQRYDLFLSALGLDVAGVNVGLPVRSYA